MDLAKKNKGGISCHHACDEERFPLRIINLNNLYVSQMIWALSNPRHPLSVSKELYRASIVAHIKYLVKSFWQKTSKNSKNSLDKLFFNVYIRRLFVTKLLSGICERAHASIARTDKNPDALIRSMRNFFVCIQFLQVTF